MIAPPDASREPDRRAAPGVGPLISRRHVMLGGLLAGVSVAGAALAPRAVVRPLRPGTLESWMPDRIGPWTLVSRSGVLLPPPDALSDRLYDNLVTRVYTAPDLPPVTLLLAYSSTQDGMLQVHRPEYCYRAGGYGLSPTQDVVISDATGARYGANTFLAVRPDASERVLYWTRVGDAFPQSWLGQRAAVMQANLAGRIPDGLLARVSSLTFDGPGPLATLESFVVAFDRAITPRLHAMLFGLRNPAIA